MNSDTTVVYPLEHLIKRKWKLNQEEIGQLTYYSLARYKYWRIVDMLIKNQGRLPMNGVMFMPILDSKVRPKNYNMKYWVSFRQLGELRVALIQEQA